MERINAYTRPTQDGVTVDVEGMLVDLVTVMKAGGHSKEQFLALAAQVFDDVQVDIRIPKGHKN